MTDDKLHPLRTGDGKWHSAASHESEPNLFRSRMDEYRRRVKEEPAVRVVAILDGEPTILPADGSRVFEMVVPIAKRKAGT